MRRFRTALPVGSSTSKPRAPLPSFLPRLTDLPDGTIVRFRYRLRWDYCVIGDQGRAYRVTMPPKPGSTVTQVVWKSGVGPEPGRRRSWMEVRRVFVMPPIS